jgi:release factor glutamine methyltransferase
MIAADTVAALLADATQRIAAALALEIREARLEARVLLAHALKVDHAWLIGHDRDTLGQEQQIMIADLIARRSGGEPVAYILGEREFYGRMFKVTPDVLIPRPETELLIEAALERLPKDRSARILDLGTGSGCIAISMALERPDCEVWAVDKSPAALTIARHNALALGANVHWHQGHWFEGLEDIRFDMLVSNPPYIADSDPHLSRGDVRFEPRTALVSGREGLADIEFLIASASEKLTEDGWLLIEHGYDQGEACQLMNIRRSYRNIVTVFDLAGHPRVTGGRRPSIFVSDAI